jgi:hypothetical protein
MAVKHDPPERVSTNQNRARGSLSLKPKLNLDFEIRFDLHLQKFITFDL